MWVVMERAVLLGSLSDVWEPLIKRMGIYMVLFFFQQDGPLVLSIEHQRYYASYLKSMNHQDLSILFEHF